MFNLTDFGNSAINSKVSGVFNAVSSLRNIQINTTNLQKIKPMVNEAIADILPKKGAYVFDADIDEMYEDFGQNDKSIETNESSVIEDVAVDESEDVDDLGSDYGI